MQHGGEIIVVELGRAKGGRLDAEVRGWGRDYFATNHPLRQLLAARIPDDDLWASIGLAYRVIEICTGDMGQSHHRSFDIEVYAPGVDDWLEVSSVSWFGDYQARRANLRYRPDGGKGTDVLHTLNGSALAVPRVWAALVEVNRREDGSVTVPEVLRPYMRGTEVITP